MAEKESRSWSRDALHSVSVLVFEKVLLWAVGLLGLGAIAKASIAAVPWGFFVVAAACLVGAFLGGWWVQFRAIRRAGRLVNWLAEKAADTGDPEQQIEEWLSRAVDQPVPIMTGTVLEKRFDSEGAVILRIQDKYGTARCYFRQASTEANKVKKGDEVAVAGRMFGLIGAEICLRECWMDGDSLPPYVGSR